MVTLAPVVPEFVMVTDATYLPVMAVGAGRPALALSVTPPEAVEPSVASEQD